MYIPYFPDCKPQLFPKCNAISLYTSAVYIYVTKYIFTYKIFLLLYSTETYSLQLWNQFTLHVLFLWCSFEDFEKGIFSDIFILIADLDKFKVPSSQYIERSKWLQVKTNLLTTMLVKWTWCAALGSVQIQIEIQKFGISSFGYGK